MSTLTDGEIRSYLASSELIIDPIDDPEMQIQPASVDLRLHKKIAEMKERYMMNEYGIDTKNIPEYISHCNIDNSGYWLEPKKFILGSTIESIKIPSFLVGEVHGKSTLGRIGLSVHVTAGFIDPGFEGNITLEMFNFGNLPIRLYPGMRICQLKISELRMPCERPYGENRGSRYKYQLNVTPARSTK